MHTLDDRRVDALKDWFTTYVKTFNTGDEAFDKNLVLKADHTQRVCTEILSLGESLGLKGPELRLAEIIALFHDVGRFEQYARYRTFVDGQSEDHAALGVQILEKNHVLQRLDAETSSLIIRAITYHNHAAIPSDVTGNCLLYSKLLRDADKLDIWKVVTDYYHRTETRRNRAIELGLPDTPEISGFVYRDIMNSRIVDIAHIHNLNDFKLLQAGWVFDINFRATLQAVRSRRYLEMIREVLPDSEPIPEIFAFIRRHVDETIGSEYN